MASLIFLFEHPYPKLRPPYPNDFIQNIIFDNCKKIPWPKKFINIISKRRLNVLSNKNFFLKIRPLSRTLRTFESWFSFLTFSTWSPLKLEKQMMQFSSELNYLSNEGSKNIDRYTCFAARGRQSQNYIVFVDYFKKYEVFLKILLSKRVLELKNLFKNVYMFKWKSR